MSNIDVANQIISSMGSQIDLIFTLSVAICGGIIALVFQIALHNSKREVSPLKIEWRGLIWSSFLVEGISLLFGYLSRGAITSNIPSIYKIDFSKINIWGEATFGGFCTIKWVINLQFCTFILGVFLLFLLVIKNLKLIVKD